MNQFYHENKVSNVYLRQKVRKFNILIIKNRAHGVKPVGPIYLTS